MKYFSFNLKAVSYAVRILLGSVIVWWSLYYLHDSKKVWALISVITVSDPDFDTVRSTVISRTVNTVTGCLTGLLFIYVFGVNVGSMLGAITLAVILSTTFKNYPSSWKLAPVTVVVVMAPSLATADAVSWQEAILIALTRTGEVLYGCLVAFLLGLAYIYLKKRFIKPEPGVVSDLK